MKPVLAWHFSGDKLRDGRPLPPIGEWLVHEGECVMCESGLHASRRLIDALQYAPGNTLCRVECADIVEEREDKLVCHKRRIIAQFDAGDLLRRAARKFALDVAHLWDAPDVVIKFLKTGDVSLRAAARDATISQRVARYIAWTAREAARSAVNAGVDAGNALMWGVWGVWDAGRYARTAACNASGPATRLAAQFWDAAMNTQDRRLTREAMKIIRKQK